MKKNNKGLLIGILVLVLLLGGAYALYNQLSGQVDSNQLGTQTDDTQTEGEEQEKVQAPDFTVYDGDGGAVYLSDYFGKPIVLNFWASWCGPCQREMPEFEEAYQRLNGEVEFLMVNMTDGQRETIDTASAFVEEEGYTFPVFYDADSDAAMTYGAYSLPTTYFLDAEGHVEAHAKGAIDAETLQVGIDMIYTPEENE